jgi:hypothetical protein
MIRLLTTLAAVLAVAGANAADEFMGIYMQGQRIGYIHSVVSTAPDGKTSSLVTTHIGAKILGQGMQMKIVSKSIRQGVKLLTQDISIASAGRNQNIAAVYGDKEIAITRTMEGSVEKKNVLIPPDALVLDDPTVGLLGKGAPEAGTKLDFYVLDPMTLALVKCNAEYLGKLPYKGQGVEGIGQKLKITDPRATTEIWMTDNGAMAFGTGPFGMVMRPITRQEAVGSEGYLPEVDIAAASRIVPDKPIEDAHTIKSLKLRLSGASLPRLKGDYFQQVVRGEDGATTITISPVAAPKIGASITAVGKAFPQHTKSGHNMPVDAPEIKSLASQILAGESDSLKASEKISRHVFKIMRPNASIGVLRDAREILKTKEGVCRDYATLAATLMRSAGIPTKLVTGAVYSQDGFYYHAWVETYVGDRWIAYDPTLGGGYADATHIKFTEGSTEEAFVTFTLDGSKIEVLDIIR